MVEPRSENHMGFMEVTTGIFGVESSGFDQYTIDLHVCARRRTCDAQSFRAALRSKRRHRCKSTKARSQPSFSSNASEAGRCTEDVTHQLNCRSAQLCTQKIENTPAAQNAGPFKCNGFICLPAAKSEA